MIPEEVAVILEILVENYDDSVEFRVEEWAMEIAWKIHEKLKFCQCN